MVLLAHLLEVQQAPLDPGGTDKSRTVPLSSLPALQHGSTVTERPGSD